MNKLKYLYIILLSVLFLNNNIISMGKPDDTKVEQETSQLSDLPDELIVNIINQAIIGQVKESINNNYNDIFNEPKTIEVNLKDIKGFRDTSVHLHDLINDHLESKSFKNIIDDLKQKRFDELFKDLRNQSIEQYKGLSTEDLNRALVDILNKGDKSKDDFKEAVKLILAGADVNAKDAYGATALMRASGNGYKEIVKILIKAGADVNVQSIYGVTALMPASASGNKEIVEILINAGADVNVQNRYGQTALTKASQNDHKEIVELLIKNFKLD